MRLRGGYVGWVSVLLVGLSCVTVTAQDGGDRVPAGRISLGGRFSDRVQEFPADVLIHLWHPGERILFANVRGMLWENREQQASAGLVLRQHFREAGVILGANSYFDHRWTEANNQFNQIGAGLELLSNWVDLRANYYYPFTDAKLMGGTDALEPCLPCGGGGRIVHYKAFEEALRGFDAEIGVWLPYVSKWVPTALYAGYYEFSSDYRGNLHGGRLRAEIRVHPNLTVDAEWYEDRAFNRVDHFVGLRVHMPLDFWNGWTFDRGRASGDRLEARMLDMVNRDFWIRTLQTGLVPVGTSPAPLSPTAQTPPAEPLSAPPPTATPEPPPPPAGRPPRPPAEEPPPPPAEEPPPTCYLDSEGEVVCE